MGLHQAQPIQSSSSSILILTQFQTISTVEAIATMAGGAVLGISLTCALFPPRGLRSTPRSLPSARKKQKQCTRKARSTKVTAMLELEPPPYPLDALEPHMSKETLEYHWGQHHKEYVENLNTQIAGTEMDTMPLREILTVSYKNSDLPTYKKAAQVWNHDFFWKSMKPGGGGRPSGVLLQQIEKDFGSFEGFVEKFKSASATQFGSGWAWLAYKANRLRVGVTIYPLQEEPKLVVVKSPETINPLVWDYYPLLAIDVWEHAYYIDFENRREDYTSIFLEKLVSWEEVSSRLEIAKGEASEREEYDKPRELIGLQLKKLAKMRSRRRRLLIKRAARRKQARSK